MKQIIKLIYRIIILPSKFKKCISVNNFENKNLKTYENAF